MKRFVFATTLLFGLISHASPSDYVQGFAQTAFNRYAAATEEARELDMLIQTFVAHPTAEQFEIVKAKWVEARKVYSVTEVYRFSDGPIDDEDGPEGLINAWPLDEGYIDYVIGDKNAGIINNVSTFPSIDLALLLEMNEKDGEKNISTGWHAIEFLLWGQDISPVGPGKRAYTDYVSATNADRRGAYLSLVSKMLVAHLEEVTVQWDPANKSGYATAFVQDTESFRKVVEAAKFLAGEELAMERMFVAYDTQLQEDEHSCFSDTTTNDVYYNFVGIKAVLTEDYNGTSFVGLVAQKDAALASAITNQLGDLDARFQSFPGPFDQAILIDSSRVVMKRLIDDLRSLSEKVGEGLALVQ